jgi:hypothetical protein
MLYLSNNGTVTYMLYPGSTKVISSAAGYNDNAWHHVVATTDPTAGSVLYLDGEAVASDAAMTSGQSYTGYWRIGGDTNSGLPNAGSSGYLAGSIDEVAVYGKALSAQQVAAHHTLGTTGELPKQDPAEQADPDDGQDAAGALADDVLISDSFTRETGRGWGTTDSGAVWTANYGVSRMSVDGSAGLMTMTGAGTANSVSSPVVESTSTDSTVDFVLDQMPSGRGVYVSYIGRANSSGLYQVGFHTTANGTVQMTVSKKVGGTETTLGTSRLSATYSAGQILHVRFVVDGAESTKLQAKAWIGEVEEPQEWGIEVTDADALLSEAGSVGLVTYTSGEADSSRLTLRVDNLVVKRLA